MTLLHPGAQAAREHRHVVWAEHRDRDRLVHDIGRGFHPQVVRGLRGCAARHGLPGDDADPLAVAGVTAQPVECGAGRLALATVETGRVANSTAGTSPPGSPRSQVSCPAGTAARIVSRPAHPG